MVVKRMLCLLVTLCWTIGTLQALPANPNDSNIECHDEEVLVEEINCRISDLPHVDIRTFDLICCHKDNVLGLDETCEEEEGLSCVKASKCKKLKVGRVNKFF